MQLNKPLKITKQLNLLLCILTVQLILSSCTVHITDEPFCALIPFNNGAVCDNLLTSNPETLNQDQWVERQSEWMSNGWAVECTTSHAIGDIKAEIEKLCSKTKCDYDTQKAITEGLAKVQNLGVIQ